MKKLFFISFTVIFFCILAINIEQSSADSPTINNSDTKGNRVLAVTGNNGAYADGHHCWTDDVVFADGTIEVDLVGRKMGLAGLRLYLVVLQKKDI